MNETIEKLETIATNLEVIEDKTVPLLLFVRMVADQPCTIRTKQPCNELPGYEEKLWCIPCLAREVLRNLNINRQSEDAASADELAGMAIQTGKRVRVLKSVLNGLVDEFEDRARIRPGETDETFGEKVAYEEAARFVREKIKDA